MEKRKSPGSFSIQQRITPLHTGSDNPASVQSTLYNLNLSSGQLIEIIEFLPDPTFVVDEAGRVIVWNKAIEEMTGIPKSEIIGKGGYLYAVPFYGVPKPIIIDYAMGAAAGIDSCYEYVRLEGDTCFAESFCPALNNGKGAFVWAKASPLYDRLGNKIGAVESIRDVTAQKRAEKALRRSAEKYRELVDNANSIILRMDTNGNVTFFNEFAEKFFGYSEDEILGCNVVGTILSPSDSHRRMLSRVIGEIGKYPEKYAIHENENLRRDGTRIWVAWTSKALLDEYGKIREILWIGNDITKRKQMEEALRESEEKYRLIFQHTPLGIFHFDAEGTVTACNDKIIEIWGSSRDKFIGFNLLSSVKNKKMKAAVKTCLSGRSACFEGSYLSVTGGKITNLKADFGPVLSSNGGIAGGIGIIEDISERKVAENALKESENRMRLISSQLIAAQEKERKRVACELHDKVGCLLTGIRKGLEEAAELVARSELNPESLRSLAAMAQQALDENARITVDLCPAMLDDMGIVTTLRWFARHFQSIFSDISVTMKIMVEEEQIPEELRIVIFRVVQEAFQNIARHSEANSTELRLERSPDRILMEIEDDGRGFAPEALSGREHVCLGLLGIRERAEFSGGQFSVQSCEGTGTVIRVVWPLGSTE